MKLLCGEKDCHKNSPLLAKDLKLYGRRVIVKLYKRGSRRQSIMALNFGLDVCASILFVNCKEIAKSRQQAQNMVLATILIRGRTNQIKK